MAEGRGEGHPPRPLVYIPTFVLPPETGPDLTPTVTRSCGDRLLNVIALARTIAATATIDQRRADEMSWIAIGAIRLRT